MTTVIGFLAILYGVVTLCIALFKPPKLWNVAKIQAFVSLLSATGTTIFFAIVGVAAITFGLWLLL